MNTTFSTLWELHHTWGKNLWIDETIPIDHTANIVISSIPGIYFSFAHLLKNELSVENLTTIEKAFGEHSKRPAFFLHEAQQKAHIPELLVRNGYIFSSCDVWMLREFHNIKEPVHTQIDEVTPESFKDFDSVLSVVFSEFEGGPIYQELCRKSLTQKPENGIDDFTSKLYVIYEDGKAVSGAGLFYSVKENFAYFHNAGTLKEHRGKGYQTDLIHHRLNVASALGISRMYSWVEQGSSSWANMIRNGFNQSQSLVILQKKT